ncbi:hypothetical protein [Demequina lignilytica]|uniref:DUF4245 domain-containing protein n=1 Tax=Demequina lignilytica TaxID=3051663 RepID=A0AB35MHM1_9MICO|nr:MULTISPECIES: hypothetical protein [unclassified Demequina]MDN4483274.1 hypothetical protein [Demequina sp. SYSU T0a273]MDN4491693.1 hypothetical protein [Demequina sp. SYSU T00068]
MSSGAAPAADAASPTREPLAVRLIGRGSLAGALLVLGIAALYAVALPMVAERASAPAPPRIVDIGGGASVVSEETWSEAVSDGGTTTLTQGGATLVIDQPHPSEGSVVARLDDLTADWIAEAPDGSVATAPRTFETDAGDDAATVVLQEPQQTVQAWVVSDGELEVIAVLTAPATAWDKTSSAAQALVRSMAFPETAP